MKFSVIIVNEGSSGDISRALNAIAAQSQRDFEVIVVGGNTALPDDRFKNVDGETTNVLAAKNSGAAIATGEWLLFLTPQSFIAEDCLASLYAASLRYPDCAMFATTVLENAEPDMIASAGKCYFFAGIPFCGGKGWPLDVLPNEGEVFGACTPAIFVRRDVFMEINGFDADFVMTCEDADLSFRLRLAGQYAMLASEAIVFVSEDNPPKDIHRFAHRNIIWTFIKNMPDVLLWMCLPFHAVIMILLLCNPVHFAPRLNGLLGAIETLPTILQKRKAIQSTRKASLDKIAGAFTWNPYIPFWHRTDIRRKK